VNINCPGSLCGKCVSPPLHSLKLFLELMVSQNHLSEVLCYPDPLSRNTLPFVFKSGRVGFKVLLVLNVGALMSHSPAIRVADLEMCVSVHAFKNWVFFTQPISRESFQGFHTFQQIINVQGSTVWSQKEIWLIQKIKNQTISSRIFSAAKGFHTTKSVFLQFLANIAVCMESLHVKQNSRRSELPLVKCIKAA